MTVRIFFRLAKSSLAGSHCNSQRSSKDASVPISMSTPWTWSWQCIFFAVDRGWRSDKTNLHRLAYAAALVDSNSEPTSRKWMVVVNSNPKPPHLHPSPLLPPPCFANMPAIPLTPLGASFIPSNRDSASLLPSFALCTTHSAVTK